MPLFPINTIIAYIFDIVKLIYNYIALFDLSIFSRIYGKIRQGSLLCALTDFEGRGAASVYGLICSKVFFYFCLAISCRLFASTVNITIQNTAISISLKRYVSFLRLLFVGHVHEYAIMPPVWSFLRPFCS